MIGSSQVVQNITTIVGQTPAALSQYTTHARQDGAFLMVVKMAFGQRLMVPQQIIIVLTTAPRGVLTSQATSENPPLYGTRFRAKEDMIMEISIMSVYTAAIGRALLLPDLHERIFCTHGTLVAQLIQWQLPIVRTGFLSAAAKNNFSRGWLTSHPLLLYRERGCKF